MKKTTIGLWVFTALFVLIGIVMISEAVSSRSWHETSATITNSKVSGRLFQSGNAINRRLEYIITATYKYSFNNNEYAGNRYSIGTGTTIAGPFNEKMEARNWLKKSKYQINNQIKIYVDPDNPAESVISNKLHWAAFVPFYIAIAFAILAWMLKMLMKRQEKT